MHCLARTKADGQSDSEWDRLYQYHQSSLVRYAVTRGCDEHEAWDVVQELFLRVHRRGMVVPLSSKTVEMQRAWLLRTLLWTIHNARRHKSSLRRSGGHEMESLDLLLESGQEVASHSTPASEYDRAWVAAILERGLRKIKTVLSTADWRSLESSLLDQNEAFSYTPSGSKTRVAAYRARVRLRHLLIKETGVGSNMNAGKTLLFHAAGSS